MTAMIERNNLKIYGTPPELEITGTPINTICTYTPIKSKAGEKSKPAVTPKLATKSKTIKKKMSVNAALD